MISLLKKIWYTATAPFFSSFTYHEEKDYGDKQYPFEGILRGCQGNDVLFGKYVPFPEPQRRSKIGPTS